MRSLWRWDNPLMRVLRVLVGFGVLAVIALSAMTIMFSFQARASEADGTALVESCEDKGPISRRGFGHHWNCTVMIREHETGERFTAEVDMSVFSPEDIGEERLIAWGNTGRLQAGERKYVPVEHGVSGNTRDTVWMVVGLPTAIALLWMFPKAIVWGFTQEGQRQFWEQIHGTPEERAAKKAKDEEFWAELRRNREQRKQARRQRKRTRDESRS